jgi:hypothetical protein
VFIIDWYFVKVVSEFCIKYVNIDFVFALLFALRFVLMSRTNGLPQHSCPVLEKPSKSCNKKYSNLHSCPVPEKAVAIKKYSK